MGEWTRGAKVGLFAIVLLGATLAIYSFVGKSRFGPKGIALHLTLKDATGLAPLSRINMAGIGIGRIKRIRVTPEGKARIDVEIDPGMVLHKDASIGKQSATLLSEPYLGMTPGSENSPVMVNDDEIVNVIEPVTTDDILQRVGDIATNVQAVTKSLRETVGNEEGERQMKAILRNVEQATFALSMIAQENRASLRKTLKNVEDITDNAKPKTAKILDNADEATARLNAIVGENRTDIRSAVKSTRETMDKASRATTTLDSALGHVDSIAARIDRGEGTVGRLTKDEALIDEVQGAAEGLNDFVGGISRLQTIVGLHSEYYFLSNSIKNYLELRLQPREDKYYLIELVSDPRGRTTITQTDVDTTNPTQPAHYREVRTETVNALRFSLQFARRLGPFTGRFGLKESTGGVALITHLFDDRFELQQDLFGFGEQLIPRWRVAFTYEFIKRLWLKGGVDNLLTRERRDYYVGLNLRFTDDDLKSFLFFAPKGANLRSGSDASNARRAAGGAALGRVARRGRARVRRSRDDRARPGERSRLRALRHSHARTRGARDARDAREARRPDGPRPRDSRDRRRRARRRSTVRRCRGQGLRGAHRRAPRSARRRARRRVSHRGARAGRKDAPHRRRPRHVAARASVLRAHEPSPRRALRDARDRPPERAPRGGRRARDDGALLSGRRRPRARRGA